MHLFDKVSCFENPAHRVLPLLVSEDAALLVRKVLCFDLLAKLCKSLLLIINRTLQGFDLSLSILKVFVCVVHLLVQLLDLRHLLIQLVGSLLHELEVLLVGELLIWG